MRGRIVTLILMLLFVTSVSAAHNRFDDRVDWGDIDWFDRGLYFESLPLQDCVDLVEFNAYADSDPYDRYDRDSIKRYADRLSYDDYKIFASRNPSDRYDVDDFDDIDDFHCSNRREFNDFADSSRSDRWDRDDFFRLYGYDDEDQFNRITRHRPYESNRRVISEYARDDGYGGIASRFRLAPLPDYSEKTSRYSGHPVMNIYHAVEGFLTNY